MWESAYEWWYGAWAGASHDLCSWHWVKMSGCEGVVSCVVGYGCNKFSSWGTGQFSKWSTDAVVGNITTKGVQPHSWPLSAAALFFVGFNKQKQRELQYLNVWQVHIHLIGTNRILRSAGVRHSAHVAVVTPWESSLARDAKLIIVESGIGYSWLCHPVIGCVMFHQFRGNKL